MIQIASLAFAGLMAGTLFQGGSYAYTAVGDADEATLPAEGPTAVLARKPGRVVCPQQLGYRCSETKPEPLCKVGQNRGRRGPCPKQPGPIRPF